MWATQLESKLFLSLLYGISFYNVPAKEGLELKALLAWEENPSVHNELQKSFTTVHWSEN